MTALFDREATRLYLCLQALIEIDKDELGIDIKKNSNTPQSTGSGTTKKK